MDQAPQGGFWIPPGALCGICQEGENAREAQRKIEARLERARIPKELWSASLEACLRQAQHESPDAFYQRVRKSSPGVLGMTTWNFKALTVLRNWHPRDGWVYLTGPVGSGKTALAYALAAKWVKAPEGREVLCLSEEEILTAHRSSSAGKGDSGLIDRARTVEILVLDDAGMFDAKERDWRVELVERILFHRDKENRTTLLTSNRPLSELAGVYGDRVTDRLTSRCGERNFELFGWSWRTGKSHATPVALSNVLDAGRRR